MQSFTTDARGDVINIIRTLNINLGEINEITALKRG